MRRSPRIIIAAVAAAAFLASIALVGVSRPSSLVALPTLSPASPSDIVATFSIVGYDPETGDLGVAVQSKFFGVGSVVPFAAAGVGAVATQSAANTSYGPRGLEMLASGMDPQAIVDALVATDPQRNMRQVAVIDAEGSAASFTGSGAQVWAGGRIGDNFSAQGNILAGPEVVDAMGEAFTDTEGGLATRLVAALAAGQAAGGDIRGRQSAALLVVREDGGFGGFNDRFIDLRVEDHETPIVELQRLLDMRHAQLRAREGERAMLELPSMAERVRSGEFGRGSDSNRNNLGAEAQRGQWSRRQELLQEAIAAFTEATVLDPDYGWYWWALATAQLGAGDEQAAAAAGVQALRVDPWVKTGILRGFGSLEVAEELLQDEDFRRAWEAIAVSYRSP